MATTGRPAAYHLLRDPAKAALRRRDAVLALRRGEAPTEVARAVGVSRQALHGWARRADPETGEVPAKTPGPAPALDACARRRLATLLDAGPRSAGLDADHWTLARVADLVEGEFGVRQGVANMSLVLRAMGYSPQLPERQARERDPAKVEEWRRTELAQLGGKSGQSPRGPGRGLG